MTILSVLSLVLATAGAAAAWQALATFANLPTTAGPRTIRLARRRAYRGVIAFWLLLGLACLCMGSGFAATTLLGLGAGGALLGHMGQRLELAMSS